MKFNKIADSILKEGEYGGWEPEENDPDKEEASKAFMGDPRDCHFANDLDGRVEKIRQQLLRGVKFRSAYMKWGHDGLVYRDTPHKDFEAALMPIED